MKRFFRKISRGTKLRILISLILLILTGGLYLLAREAPGLLFPWYQTFSRKALSLWAHVTDLVPFSILEWGLVAAIWLVLGWSIRNLVKRNGWGKLLTTALLVVSVILFLFVSLWGADQFAPTFLSTTPYNETKFSPEEAARAAEYYLQMANAYARSTPRDENGLTDFGEFTEIADGVESGYRYLEETYGSRFAIGDVTPKGMAFSYYMDCIGFTGIFTAYTGEMGINTDTPDQSLPFTISHECAHRTTVTQENDANFAAFLACIHSEEEMYRYSGYYSAFIYCYNAIAKVDKETQSRLWNAMDPLLQADVLAANAHYAQFDKPVKKAAQKANDSYLKTFNQPTGVNNYGAVAGALIAWYWIEIAGAQKTSL